MNGQRVFVTGYGTVSPLDSTEASNDMFDAMCALSPNAEVELEHFWNRAIEGFSSNDFISPRTSRRMDRFTQLAYVAVAKALGHAQLDLGAEDPERVGLIMNTCFGPLDSLVGYLGKVIEMGAKRAAAGVFPNTVYNAFTGRITIDFKALGTNTTVSGYNPVAYGVDMIREGLDDIMIVGGCDELTETATRGFQVAGNSPRVAEGATGPVAGLFGDGDAMPFGEGAAVLVLESEASVRRRGVTPLAEIGDYGMTCMAGELNSVFPSDRECFEVAMEQALDRSGVDATSVDFVSAAGNGLRRTHDAEDGAIDGVFGVGTKPWVCNAKSGLGETLGASSTFATILAVAALDRETLPAQWGRADRGADSRHVTGEARPTPVRRALVNGLELSGCFTSMVVQKAA